MVVAGYTAGWIALLGTPLGTMSVIQFSTNLFAGAIAPFAVGLLSDVFGGEDSLMLSMGIVFPVMFLAALAFFAVAWKLDRAGDAKGKLRPDFQQG